MKELQKIIDIAIAEKAKAGKEAEEHWKTDDYKRDHNRGKVWAFDFVIDEAELLIKQMKHKEQLAQLNKHDVSGWQEFENMWISEYDEVLVKNKRRGHYLIWKTDELDFSDVHLKEYCWMPLPA